LQEILLFETFLHSFKVVADTLEAFLNKLFNDFRGRSGGRDDVDDDDDETDDNDIYSCDENKNFNSILP
jgi:hypothetical protein